MNSTQEPNHITLEVQAPMQQVLQLLAGLEQEGQLMQERLQASIAIEKGKLAAALKQQLGAMLAANAGMDLQRQPQFTPDFGRLQGVAKGAASGVAGVPGE
jgi:hypothetical protein